MAAKKENGLGLVIELDLSPVQKSFDKLGRQLNPQALLKLTGQSLLFWINENFRRAGIEVPWAPLSANTLSNPKRGSGAQILRDTGRLAQSFTSFGVRVSSQDSVTVGTEVPYAKYHHFGGTREYFIRPKQAKVLAFWTASGLTFRRVVKHPPLPKRPMLPSEKLARKIASDALTAYINTAIKNSETRR